MSNLTPQQVEALILHELAHIRRQDYLLNLWIAALEVLFFFNPFSKLLIRSIQKEREHRCDDLVLQFRYDPHTYVSALLALARGIQGNPSLVLAATGSNNRLLLQRVRRILRLRNAPEPLKGRPLVFLFFTLFLTGMMLSRPVFSVARMAENQAPVTPASQEKQPDEASGSEINMTSFTSGSQPVKNKHEAATARKHTKLHGHNAEEATDASSDYADQEMIQASDPEEDEDESALIGYASSVQVDKRDYSITATTTATLKGEGCALQIPAPYVPNSSFSFQNIQDSTTLPGEQYVYLQQMATRQVELAIARMQKELQIQLKLLEQAGAGQKPELKQQRQILLEQLKLQQQYLTKQQQLQRKLERVGKKRVIVVI
jgi:hypothetical protein